MHFRALLTASCALLVTHAAPFSVFAQDVAASKPASIAIVELFTSEGCSSCPPADALLRQINLKQTNTGQLIVGISEHVTYWNNLGWRDPYSLPVFTERQSVYASRLSAEGSYTPQMVLNGRDQFVGSNGGALQHALLGRLSAQSSGPEHPFVEPDPFGSGCHVFPEATCSEAARHHCGAD
jgi:hypothetical protein